MLRKDLSSFFLIQQQGYLTTNLSSQNTEVQAVLSIPTQLNNEISLKFHPAQTPNLRWTIPMVLWATQLP